jgi:DNA-binding transcriptional ArsR family regulator
MTQTRDVFQAIADPTRRQIIGMLAGETLNVNAIADKFKITRQAVSLHIQFLNDCGLVSIKKQGRERYCEASLDRLNEVSDWVDSSKKVWMQRFRSLEVFLEQLDKQNEGKTKNKRKHAKRK